MIARAAKNNRQAQHQLYQEHSPKMLSVCRLYIKDLQQAEECMLNGFYKVFQHLKNFKNEGSFEGWIRKIMIRECLSYIRQQKKIYFEDINESPTEIDYSTIETPMDTEYIQQLIDNLPEGYKMVFVMYAIEGYKHQEIAKLLNIEVGTSKSQLSKARKLLQENLAKLQEQAR